MSDELPYQPRKEPSQDRSRFLVEAILEATARILRTDGPAAISTNRIAEVAGVSVGSLYQYFPNKEAVVARLLELELERDITFFAELLESSDEGALDEGLRAFCEAAVARCRDQWPLHQHILPMVPELERRSLVRGRFRELEAAFLAFLEPRTDELAPVYRGQAGRARLETAVFVAIRGVEAAINAAKTEAPDKLDEPAFLEHITSILTTILIEGSPAAS